MLNSSASQNNGNSTRNRSNTYSINNNKPGSSGPVSQLGQENRRPLLHRIFGGGGAKTATAQAQKTAMPLSSSVGAVNRATQNSYFVNADHSKEHTSSFPSHLASTKGTTMNRMGNSFNANMQQSSYSTGQMSYLADSTL